MPRPENETSHAPTRPRRVVVIGTTGSGKSTVAARLAHILQSDHIELDAFQHGPHWTPRTGAEFDADVAAVGSRATWVLDGNYISRVATTLWPEADLIVWLDLPLRVILPRIVRRTVRRIRSGTELWAGNRERWSALFGRHSLLLWAIQSQRTHKSVFPAELAAIESSGVQAIRLTSRRAIRRWLAGMESADPRGIPPSD